jgi:hypothetical protein
MCGWRRRAEQYVPANLIRRGMRPLDFFVSDQDRPYRALQALHCVAKETQDGS